MPDKKRRSPKTSGRAKAGPKKKKQPQEVRIKKSQHSIQLDFASPRQALPHPELAIDNKKTFLSKKRLKPHRLFACLLNDFVLKNLPLLANPAPRPRFFCQGRSLRFRERKSRGLDSADG